MKYKVIEVRDDNNEGYYELWYHRPMFWNSDRWIPEKTYGFRYSYTRRFKCIEEIEMFLKGHRVNRKVIFQGDTDNV